MFMKLDVLLATALAATAIVGTAGAAELRKIAEIPVPGQPLASFGISFLDQASQRVLSAPIPNLPIQPK